MMNRAKSQAQKLLAIVAALLLCVVLVYAEPTEASPFKIQNNGRIYDYDGSETEIVIPETVNGIPVTGIDDNAFYFKGITRVEFPAALNYIGMSAFEDTLTYAKFTGPCPTLGAAAFDCGCECTFEVPNAYLADYETALEECFYATIKGYGEAGGDTENPTPPAPTPEFKIEFTTADNADGCTVTGFTIVDNGAEIPAAYSLEIPAEIGGKPVTAIGEQAFLSSRKVESITLPESLKVIGSGAFQGCSALTEITIPASVETIGERAFLLCSSLQNIHVAADNAAYCDVDGVLFSKDKTVLAAFPGARTGSYAVPEGTVRIAPDAFRSCALTDVSFPESLTAIGDRAFQSAHLEKVVVPAHVKMGSYVYANCAQAKSAEVAEGVTEITDSTFHGLDSCESVTLPRSLKVIGDYAFRRLKAENITLPDGLERIGKQAFESSGLTSVKIPASVKEMDYGAFLYSKEMTNVQFAPGSQLKDLAPSALGHCYHLDQVDLPKGLTTIGDGALACSGLRNIRIPDSVTTIGQGAFSGCGNLTQVTLPKNLSSVGWDAFKDCPVSEVSLPHGFNRDLLPAGTFPADSVNYTTRSNPSYSYEEEPAELPQNPVTGGQKLTAAAPAPARRADPVAPAAPAAPVAPIVPETAPRAQKVLPEAPAAVEAPAESTRSMTPILVGVCIAGALLVVGAIGILKKRKAEQK